MDISIKSIPHAQQRYDTWGDWWFEPDGSLQIRVSNDVPQLPTDKERFLIALHELVEVQLCQARGITQQQVDDFDFAHIADANRDDVEVADLPGSPYAREHRFAMLIEHLMSHELGLQGYGVVV